AVEAEDQGAVVVIGHDLGQYVGDSRVHRQARPLVGAGGVEHVSLRVGNLKDRLVRVVHAHVGDGGEGGRVLEHGDGVSAQSHARPVLVSRRLRVVAAVRI